LNRSCCLVDVFKTAQNISAAKDLGGDRNPVDAAQAKIAFRPAFATCKSDSNLGRRDIRDVGLDHFSVFHEQGGSGRPWKVEILAYGQGADISVIHIQWHRCELEGPAAYLHQALISLFKRSKVSGNKLGLPVRSHLANDTCKRGAIGSGHKQKIDAHMLTKLAQLIFHSAARSGVARFGSKQLHAGLECCVISCNLQKVAILGIGFGMHARDREFACTQGCAQAVPDSGLRQPLDQPETGCQQHCEGDKANKKDSNSIGHGMVTCFGAMLPEELLNV